jgi:hypothetical protein
MTIAIIINAALALIVFASVLGIKLWAIHTARPTTAAPVPAHNPRVREHAVRARAAHADRARAARRHVDPVGAQ